MNTSRIFIYLFPLTLAASTAALADSCYVNAIRDRVGNIEYVVSDETNTILQSTYDYNEVISYAENDVNDGYCNSVTNNVGLVIPNYPVRYIYYPYVRGVYFIVGFRPGFYPYGYCPGFYYADSFYRGYGYRGPLFYGEYRGGVYVGYHGGGGSYQHYQGGFNTGHHQGGGNSGYHGNGIHPAPHHPGPRPPVQPRHNPMPMPPRQNPRNPGQTTPRGNPTPAPHHNPAPHAPTPHANPAPRAPASAPAPRAPAPHGRR